MNLEPTYFIDISVVFQIFHKNIWYITKLILMGYIGFYLVPIKIFPQEHLGKGINRVIANMVYMVAYVETVVPFLVFIKAFSIGLFLISLIFTKLLFLKFYYHKDIWPLLDDLLKSIMRELFIFLDRTREFSYEEISKINKRIIIYLKSLTPYFVLRNFIFFLIFAYIIAVMMTRGLLSYANPIPDTSQFIDWVSYLHQNILYPDNKTSADLFGQAISIFFVNSFTNIDPIILFSLYPFLLITALYLSIYYVAKDFSGSRYVAIFAVMMHGMVFLTPLSNYFFLKLADFTNPHLVTFFGLHIYMPDLNYIMKKGHHIAQVPYLRYISGLAYEHASVFVLLNGYFLIKTLSTHLNRFLVLYGLTLLLVFTFHGGGAIVLMLISIFIAINSIIFKKLNLKILKKGVLTVLTSTIVGNLWILSVLKYGIPQDFGDAAPFLDKMLGTKTAVINEIKHGIDAITLSPLTYIHLIALFLIIFAFIFSFFTKKRFENSSLILFVVAIFLLYFGPNLGLPALAKQSRLAEYMLLAFTILSFFYYHYFIDLPIMLIFKKYGNAVMLFITYMLFIVLVLVAPKWVNTKVFWQNINFIEYSSISDILLKIDKENRPFSWTVISYVQEYSKTRDKGYHINTQKFLFDFNPNDKFLKIRTPKVFIFVENFPNPYIGKEEWFYRWRDDIQNDLKSWVAQYSATHSNIELYYKTKTVTVYKIDNEKYVKYMNKLDRLKKRKKR